MYCETLKYARKYLIFLITKWFILVSAKILLNATKCQIHMYRFSILYTTE